jgi:predicted acetyltransferase
MAFIYINNTPVDLDQYPDIANMDIVDGLEEIFVLGIVGNGMTREEFQKLFCGNKTEVNVIDVDEDDDAGKEYKRQLRQQEYKVSLKNKYNFDISNDMSKLTKLWNKLNIWIKLKH